MKSKHQDQDANQPRAECLYASIVTLKINACVAFACVGGPEKPNLCFADSVETFLYSSHTLVAKTSKMSRGVYYMLQFTDTQSNLSAPGHIEFYYFFQS